MFSSSSTADYHHRLVAELTRLDRVIKKDQAPPALRKSVAHALNHYTSRASSVTLGRGNDGDSEEEFHAALVASAYAEANSSNGTTVEAASEHLNWWAKLRKRIFHNDVPDAHKYADFDVHWLTVIEKRVAAAVDGNRASFQTHASIVSEPREELTIGVVGDWGTGLPESDLVMAQLMRHQPAYTIHLGDVYYAGTEKEVRERFLAHWPKDAKNSFSLNSNHEMYSGGEGYFNQTLADDRFARQKRTSFFALQNPHFAILGLDSAYHADRFYEEGKLDKAQLEFAKPFFDANKFKRLIVMTHHHGLDEANKRTALFEQIEELRAKGAKGTRKVSVLWVWGHLHVGIAHEPDDGVHGRCVGHGGIPYEPFDAAEAKRYRWTETQRADDAREPTRGLNGFYLMKLSGEQLTETFYDERGNEKWSSNIF